MNTPIKEFLVNEFHLDPDLFDKDSALFSNNVLDSFCLVQLINFIEKNYNLKLQPIDMALENFDSISKISNFIKNKQSN